MAKIKFLINTRHKKLDGTHQIQLRITHLKQRKIFDVGYSVSEKNWDVLAERVIGKHPDRELINAKITSMKTQVCEYELACHIRKEPFDLRKLFPKNRLLDKGSSLYAFLEDYQTNMETNGSLGFSLNIKSLISVLKQFKEEIYCYDLQDPNFVQKIVDHFRSKGNKASTINERISIMRRAYNRAIKLFGAPAPNPFVGISLRSEKTRKEKLTPQELALLESFPVLNKKQRLNRDLFMFSYYCRGIRFENVITLRKDQIFDGRVHFQIVKSKKIGSQEIHSKLRQIIDRYIDACPGSPYLFPIIPPSMDLNSVDFHLFKASKSNTVNNSLRDIAKKVGIRKYITFHCARHSFAHYMFISDKPIGAIQQALGHGRIDTTQRYLGELSSKAVDIAVNSLYGEAI